MPEQIDSISIKVTLDDRQVLKQLNKIKSIASNIPVKLNINSFNNQINRMQNRLNNLVLNPQVGQGIGANIAKQISNEVKNAFSGNVLGNIIGETLSAKVTGNIISENLENIIDKSNIKNISNAISGDIDTNIESKARKIVERIKKSNKQFKMGDYPVGISEKEIDYIENLKTEEMHLEEINKLQNKKNELIVKREAIFKNAEGRRLTQKDIKDSSKLTKSIKENNEAIHYSKQRLIELTKAREKYSVAFRNSVMQKYRSNIVMGPELPTWFPLIEPSKIKKIKPPPLPKQPKTSWQKLTGFLGSGMGLAGGSLGVFYGATKTIKVMQQLTIESAKSQQITAKLNGVLAATGNTTGFTSKQLNKLAEQLSLTTNFTDEQITSAQTLLATYSNISGKIFKKTLDAATDLAEVIGTDIVGSAKVLGRILNDPLASLSSIRKLGISLSKEQKSQIENLINQNKLYEAQLIILDEINSKVGGGGANNVNKLTQIGKAWDEVKESVGDILIDIGQYTGAFDNTLNALRGLNEGLNNTQDIAKGTVGIFRLWNNPLSGISNIISGSMTEESKNKINSFFENVGKKIENVGKKINSGIKYLKIDKGVKKLLGIDNKPIEPLFKTPKVLLNDKAQDKLTTTLDKAKNKSKELKDNLMDAFNISDISNWWDIFIQSTVDLQNKITNGLIDQQMMNNNRFNSPTDSPIIEAIEDGNRDNFDLMEEQNELLSQIARNGGIFA